MRALGRILFFALVASANALTSARALARAPPAATAAQAIKPARSLNVVMNSDSPAVLRVYDEKTRSRVVLVGTMHYNPHSIAVARDVIAEEAAKGDLRAVAVESCASRWNSTLELAPQGSLLRSLCDNEMQEAAESGEAAGATLVLADQPIEETGRRITQLFALTLVELFTPWAGGWNRIGSDLQQAFGQALSWGEEGEIGLPFKALVDPRLALGAPLSFARYPISVSVRSPLFGLLLLAVFSAPWVLAAFDYIDYVEMGGEYVAGRPEASLGELIGSIAFSILETVVLGRVLLVGLLEERNYVLARNIRKALFDGKPGGSLVAVMGMAHCTGVGKLLKESRIV